MRIRPVADLGIAAAVTVVALLVTLLVHGATVVHVLLAVPLVLLLPGYALGMVALPGSAVGPVERLTLSLGASLALAALGGLVLNMTPWSLTTESWTAVLAAVTLAGCLLAWWRRLSLAESSAAFDGLPLDIQPGQLALFGVAILIGAGALRFSSVPPAELPSQGYTLLWAVPDPQLASSVNLGVQNLQPGPQNYLLRVNQGDQTLQEWSLQLEPATVWQADFHVPDANVGTSGDVRVTLYPADNPETPVRQAVIRRPSSGTSPELVPGPTPPSTQSAPAAEPLAAAAPAAPAALPTAAPAPAVVAAPATPTARPTAAPARVTAPAPTAAQPTAAPARAATATPSAADQWQTLEPELAAAWGQDTAQTMALLDAFLSRFPDYAPAREKLYAALIARGLELASAGVPEAAVEPLSRAQELAPERGEAAAVLLSLTPTPAPTEVPRVVVPAQPAPAPVRRVTPVPAPPRPPAPPVEQPAPVPTKVPFRPPAAP